jgi:hypothetical protein
VKIIIVVRPRRIRLGRMFYSIQFSGIMSGIFVLPAFGGPNKSSSKIFEN